MPGWRYNVILQSIGTIVIPDANPNSFISDEGIIPSNDHLLQKEIYDIGNPMVKTDAGFGVFPSGGYYIESIFNYPTPNDDGTHIHQASDATFLDTGFPVTYSDGVILGFPVIGGYNSNGDTNRRDHRTTNVFGRTYRKIPWCTGLTYYAPLHQLDNAGGITNTNDWATDVPITLRMIKGKKPNGNVGYIFTAIQNEHAATQKQFSVGDTTNDLTEQEVIMEASFLAPKQYWLSAGTGTVSQLTLPFGGIFAYQGGRLLLSAYIKNYNQANCNVGFLFRHQLEGYLKASLNAAPCNAMYLPPEWVSAPHESISPFTVSTRSADASFAPNDAPTI